MDHFTLKRILIVRNCKALKLRRLRRKKRSRWVNEGKTDQCWQNMIRGIYQNCLLTIAVVHLKLHLLVLSAILVYRNAASAHEYCMNRWPLAGPPRRAGPVNTITRKTFSPVNRDPGIAKPGSRLAELARFSYNRGVDFWCVSQPCRDLGRSGQLISPGQPVVSCNQALTT